MNRRVAKTFIASTLLVVASHAAHGFDRDAWRQDYAQLKVELEHRYANLAWFASAQGGVNLPTLDRRTQRFLELSQSDDDAKSAILNFVSSFHDGHFSQVPTLGPAAGKSADPPKADFASLGPAAQCAALGYASTRSVPFSLPFESLRDFRLETDGISKPFRAGTIASDGKRFGIVRIKYFRQRDFPMLCEQVVARFKVDGKKFDTDALNGQIDDAWFAALAAQLKAFQAENVDAVVVDVGNNGGGNDAGDWTPRLFTSKPVHSARLLLSAVSESKGYFDEQLDGLHTALKTGGDSATLALLNKAIADFEKRKSDIASRACDLSWAWREQHAWNPAGCSRLIDAGFASGAVDYLPVGTVPDRKRASALYWAAAVDAYRGAWDGRVYVLTDGRTYSSAEMFSAVMRDNGIAKTIGARTGGDGCGFMQDEKPFVLTHSKLRFRIPDCVRLRADGGDEVAGIAPDLPILPTEGESDRARAARMLVTIENDLATPAK
jgi:hypothetical protein